VSNPEPSARAPDTVLVVESDVLVRAVIADYLRECGFRVIEAVSADEALVVLREKEIRIDVILADVNLPGAMDGFALSQWIRTNRPGADVILAGSPRRAAHAAGELCEDGPHMARPYDPKLVHDRIMRLLAARKTPK
jgi:CheY-like chemotaxis protein